MTIRPHLVPVPLSASDMPVILKAHAITHNLTSGKRSLTIDGQLLLVQVVGQQKRIIVLTPGAYDLSFTPVADDWPIPGSVDAAVEDYRTGLATGYDDAEDVKRRHAGGPLVMHTSFDQNNTALKHVKTKDAIAGTSSWYGDSPNVISWNGIGGMDAAANDYRMVNRAGATERYTMPPFELQYYDQKDAYQAPESTNHLMGDRAYACPEQKDKGLDRFGYVYRNGVKVASMQWQVLTACERLYTAQDGTKKWRLRIVCAPWLKPPTEYGPIQNDTDNMFQSYTLTSLYLYDERDDEAGVYALTIIDLPAIDADHTNEAFVAQAPLFDATGATAYGIIETGFFVGSSAGKQYDNGRWRNQSQAWVLKLDAVQKTAVLDTPASTYHYERDKTQVADSVYEKQTRSQTLSVAPVSASSFRKLVRTDTVTQTKRFATSDTSRTITYRSHAFQYKFLTASEAVSALVRQISDIMAVGIPAALAWYSANNGGIIATALNLSFVFDGNSSNYAQYNHDYVLHAYAGSSGSSSTAWSYNTTTGVYDNNPARTARDVAQTIANGLIYSPPSGYMTAGDNGYVPGSNRTQTEFLYLPWTQTNTTTTVTSTDIKADDSVIFTESKTDSVKTDGVDVGWGGAGMIYGGVGLGYYSGYNFPQVWLHLDYSFGPQRYPSAVTTTDAALHGGRVVAADMRKSAVVVKDTTTGAFSYYNVNNGPL